MKIVGLLAVLILHFAFFMFPAAAVLPLEGTVSSRQSTRNFSSQIVSGQQLLEVLWLAYGYKTVDKSVPQMGYNHSLIVFAVNASGSYRYVPESNSLVVHDLGVNKETIRSHDGGWPSDANIVLVVVWNQTALNNQYLASAEAGFLVQNVYLSSVSFGLGTCCVGGVDFDDLHADLGLQGTMTPLLVMPLGYPTASYPSASPNHDLMTGNLPPVQYSIMSFEEALGNMTFVREWSVDHLPVAELSQLLWAGYGYTSVTSGSSYHRTTPSSWGIYPLVVFVSNATGVYRYSPEDHSLSEMVQGDKRLGITNATASQVWVSEAPAIFLIVYNSSYNGGNTGDGGAVPHEFIEVDAGAVVQQILLEASARNLRANVVSAGLEDWNGTTAEQLRGLLSMPSSLIPLCAVPVGFPSGNRTITHDIAVISMVPSKNIVGQGFKSSITISVANLGTQTETFNLTGYCGNNTIITQIVSLISGSLVNVTFVWDTTSLPRGNYTLTAYAEHLLEEIDVSNNNCTSIPIHLGIPGDISSIIPGIYDRACNMRDIQYLIRLFNTNPSSPNWRPNADINNDGIANMRDIQIAILNFNQHE